MRRVEEEEEFIMATKRLKSNKSAAALRAVSHLNKLKSNKLWTRKNLLQLKATKLNTKLLLLYVH